MDSIFLKPMELSHVYYFRNWGRHKNPLYQDYNFNAKTDEDVKFWYNFKIEGSSTIYYTIFYKNTPAGFIDLKDINRVSKYATLGIVIDPSKLDQGIGSSAIEKIFDVGKDLGLNKIYLQVARYNKRAIHVYKKLDFKKCGVGLGVIKGNFPLESNEDIIDLRVLKLYYIDKMVKKI